MDLSTVDESLQRLSAHKDRWARLPIKDRIAYLTQVRDLLVTNADAWVQAGVQMKGLDPQAAIVGGEEWLGGPYPTAAWLTEMIATLTRLESGADPLDGVRISTRPDGQVVAGVFPSNAYDRLLLNGYELEVWMQPEVTPTTLRDHVASFYRRKDPQGAEIGLATSRIGSSSITYRLGIFRADDPQLRALAHFVHVYVDEATRRPVPIPDVVRAAVETLPTVHG